MLSFLLFLSPLLFIGRQSSADPHKFQFATLASYGIIHKNYFLSRSSREMILKQQFPSPEEKFEKEIKWKVGRKEKFANIYWR